MRRTLLRRLLRLLLVLSLPVLLMLGGFGYWLSTSLPETTGKIVLAGLKQPVQVIRDRDGIPHIFARNDEDAAFALGFLHAQDRLWQMEQMRRLGAGRLAELVGDAALPFDRFTRTVGLERLAEAQLAGLTADMRAALDAYTNGVNAFLAHHKGAWPPEFTLLNTAPEPWRPTDSLLWDELMAVRLSGHWHTALLRARLLTMLSAEQVDQLWPPYPAEAPTTLVAAAGELTRQLPVAKLADLAAAFDGHGASNAWVVDGAHSETGKPLLANDPHLGFSLPTLWYLVRIETPTLHLAGASAPGVPIVILGHNDRIAWGMTTTGGDVEDLFIEKLDPSDPSRYLTPEGSRPFRTRSETIAVRGRAPVTLEIRETRHGPVLSDVVEPVAAASERGTVMALAATWLEPQNRVAHALYGINRARNWGEFTAALADFDGPEQNLVYADADGHIGFYAAGRVPVRKAGDGRLPVPGWTGNDDWAGYIPFAELPHGLDPASGHFANANNKVTPPGYPYAITRDGWDQPYRAKRIESMLAARPKATLEAFQLMQGDVLSLAARALLPLLTTVDLPGPDAQAVLARMREWDGGMARGRPEPLVYAAWLRELHRTLFAERLGSAFRSFWNTRPELITSIFAAHPEWCARPGTAPRPDDCRARSAQALERALGWIEARYGKDPSRWRWGDAHQAQFNHRLFDRIPLIGRLVDVRFPADGGTDTLNRAGFDVADEHQPFADIHGAGFRAIYDLADLSRSRFIISTGQSGNPFSRHFTDLVPRWRNLDYVRLAGSPAALIADGGETLTLVPP